MLQTIRTSYTHTIYASYIGYITQAAVNNFVPLLFLTLSGSYDLTLDQITLLTTVNFMVQLCVDLLSARFIDRIGYRAGILAAHVLTAAGLIGLAVFPQMLNSAYAGLLAAVVLYAIGGGIIEVLISPIVEACPTEKKEAAMSLLHSFYCWGHLAVVLLSTAFFTAFGIENWRVLACLWALIPVFNIFYFSQVPIYPITADGEKTPLHTLLGQKTFWLIVVLMVCAGASEQAMSQWTSAFAESALHVSKTVGDLAGPCAFAFSMGTARALYGKFSALIPLKKAMLGSAALCIVCYALAVFAGSPVLGGGTAMYALMALAGDLGCSAGPTVVGMVAASTGGALKAGLLAAVVFPALMLLGVSRIRETKNGA